MEGERWRERERERERERGSERASEEEVTKKAATKAARKVATKAATKAGTGEIDDAGRLMSIESTKVLEEARPSPHIMIWRGGRSNRIKY